MKVLIAVRRLDKGGAELLECRLAQYLNKVGIETHLLAQYSKEQFDGAASSQRWKAKGIPAVFFLNSKNGIGLLQNIYSLFLLCKKEKYDVVISSNSGLDTLVGIVKVACSFKQLIAFHTYINQSILKSIRIKLWIFFVRRADAYYSITDYVRNNINETLHVNTNKNSTIYNSIDQDMMLSQQTDYFIRESNGLSSDSKIILLAGRIEARKGFDLALTYVQEVIRTSNTYLVIAGEQYSGHSLEAGLQGFAEAFNEQVKKMGLEDKVLFIGYRSDLQQLMKQADVYVHLARHEGFGLVLLEAIAAKVPVVASHVGGIPEVLRDTPYKTFALEDATGIGLQVQQFLSMNTKEKKALVEEACKVLPFYTDERRGEEVKQVLNRLTI